jgi:hypothetical protein
MLWFDIFVVRKNHRTHCTSLASTGKFDMNLKAAKLFGLSVILGTVPTVAVVNPASALITYTVDGVSCSMRLLSNRSYGSMWCNTSKSYKFSASLCRTSCSSAASDTNSNNRAVKLRAPVNTAIGSSYTVYFNNVSKGSYNVPAID